MKKLYKRISATAVAAVLSLGIMGMTAVAAEPVMDENWETYFTRTNYTGFYTGKRAECYMVYSPNGYQMYCNGFKCSKDGASGYVEIECTETNATMSTKTIYDRCDKVLNPTVTNPVKGMHFEFSAYTDVLSNVVTANGTLHSIEK